MTGCPDPLIVSVYHGCICGYVVVRSVLILMQITQITQLQIFFAFFPGLSVFIIKAALPVTEPAVNRTFGMAKSGPVLTRPQSPADY